MARALTALVALVAAAYAVLAVAGHRAFRTGYDLGVFDQALWHAWRLETPASTLRGLDHLLEGHFSPIVFVLAPLGTEGLLVAQAVLVSLAAVPIFAFARRRIGDGPALAIAVAYLLFGGVQEAVAFDFHEVAFAPLLIAVAVERHDAGARRTAYAAALALLLVKEDLALLLPFIGAYFALRGDRRAGAALAVAGLAAFLVLTRLVTDDYTNVGGWLDAPGMKLRTLAYTFGAFLGLSLLSPIVLLAIPLLAVRFLSDVPEYWTLEYHYSLSIAPVLALAAADALRRLDRRLAYGLAVIAVALTPAFTGLPDTAPPAYADALERIPPGAPVIASNRLVPHLSRRDDIRLLEPGAPTDGYVIATTDDPSNAATFPFADLAALRAHVARLPGRRVYERGGVVVIDATAATSLSASVGSL